MRFPHLIRYGSALRLRRRLRKRGIYEEIIKNRPQAVRLLWLPPNAEQASDAEWMRAAGLCTLLADPGRLSYVLTLPNDIARENDPSRWMPIVVPTSLDCNAKEIRDDEALRRKLSGIFEPEALAILTNLVTPVAR